MGHLTPDELQSILTSAAQQVETGAMYRHYKGQTYTVVDVAILEATDESAVVYRANYDPRLTFVRELRVWLETVTVDGKTLPRFRKLDN